MRHDEKFSRYFKILGIEPSSDWQQVRKAYRHKARIWHPDRLPDIDNIRAQAEEKFKDVNHAFHTLSAYHRRHGRLPNIQPRQTRSSNHTKSRSRATPKSTTNTSIQKQAKQWLARPLNRRILMSTALLMIAYGLWWPAIPTETSAPAPETNGSVQTQQKQTRLIDYGSSVSDVYEIQGTPTRTVGSVWLYGSSQILFENGVVVGWEENADTPLKTQDANPAETFKISR
ncbi:MAG: J domain-containing protein [Gammaproteobacteria bacterium]|nr:J domain-containing protein [Gammaproteobacteria bacterium]